MTVIAINDSESALRKLKGLNSSREYARGSKPAFTSKFVRSTEFLDVAADDRHVTSPTPFYFKHT